MGKEEHTVTEEMVITLVKKAQSGDVRAFEQLTEQYYQKIYNIALGMVGSHHDAQDAAQNVLIKLYRSIGSFKFQSKFSTWVYRVTANVCMDEIRSRKRAKSNETVDISEKTDVASSLATPEESALSKETSSVLRKAIASLKPQQREMIILRDVNGFSYTQIAEILKCSEGTVKSRISRARDNLKRILEQSGYFGK